MIEFMAAYIAISIVVCAFSDILNCGIGF